MKRAIPDSTYIRIRNIKNNLLYWLQFFCTNLGVNVIDAKFGSESDAMFLMKGRCRLYSTKILSHK